MRDIFPTYYQSVLNQQAISELYVADWLLHQLEQYRAQDYDWTARMYEGLPISLHEYQYGFPAPDRINSSYIRELRALLATLLR